MSTEERIKNKGRKTGALTLRQRYVPLRGQKPQSKTRGSLEEQKGCMDCFNEHKVLVLVLTKM